MEETKKILGVFPPHWEFYVKLNPKRFKMFIAEILYLSSHPTINPDLFAFLRLFVANKEGFSFCKSFNTKFLLTKGYSKSELQVFMKEIRMLPLDEKHKSLILGVKKALYDAENFTKSDIDKLKEDGWSDADIFDAIDHGAFLFKFSKILKAYLA